MDIQVPPTLICHNRPQVALVSRCLSQSPWTHRLDALRHIFCETDPECSCCSPCHVNSDNNVQIHSSFSRNRFHAIQQENTQKASGYAASLKLQWFTEYTMSIWKQEIILWIGPFLVYGVQMDSTPILFSDEDRFQFSGAGDLIKQVLVCRKCFVNQRSAIKWPLIGELCTYLFTYLLTTSTEQNHSWEANRFSASQEFMRILWNPKVHYLINKCPPPVPILSELDPVYTPTSHFLNVHLNIILPSTPGSPKWSLSLRFPHQTPVHTSPFPYTRYMHHPSHSSRFYHPHNIEWGVQIIKLPIK